MFNLRFGLITFFLSYLLSTGINGQIDLNRTLEPTQPSVAPTLRPSRDPSESPTSFPTVAVASNLYLVITARVSVNGIDNKEVQTGLTYFEVLFGDSGGLDNNLVDISVARTEYHDDPEKQYYADCNSVGVNITYEMITQDTNDYSQLRLSILTGEFYNIFNDRLLNSYGEDSGVELCLERTGDVIDSYEVVTKKEAYPPSPSPSLEEKLWSEYLFLGFITSLLGVIWLWYLRSDVDDDNIYATNDGGKMNPERAPTNSNIDRNNLSADMNDTAVEMTGQ